MYVGIKGDVIDYIGSKEPTENYGESYDGKRETLDERILQFPRPYADDPDARLTEENLSLQDWLNTRIFPFEDKTEQ